MTQPKYSTTPVAVWLYACAFAVLAMAVIGAVTRLTESGLSIVEWKPITGALPPMDDASWTREFDLYKKSPQYIKVNAGMSLLEFKNIYFWEWLHRLWGRMIGLIYFVPFVYFWARGRLPRESLPSFAGILALGFLQGFMGWYMVKSGLVDQPAVSHYRLAAHLILAWLIYAALLRTALRFSVRPSRDASALSPLRGRVRGALMMVVITMTWGAFVAGLRAGLLYNTFPTMNGHWFPPEMMAVTPVWKAFVAEPATVQFTHRVLAVLTLLKIFSVAFRARAFHLPARVQGLITAVVVMALVQVALGISTLLLQVPVALAATHQAGAFILTGLLVALLHDIPVMEWRKDVPDEL